MSIYYSIPPQVYDDQFWWKKDDLEFWKNELDIKKANILELGSGTGRIAESLIGLDLNYTGLDLSSEYTLFAKNKFKQHDNFSFFQGDMSHFSLNKKYDIIFIAFNSFLHLLKYDDAIKCLAAISTHMHSKSRLIIDIFVPHPLFLYRPKNLKMHIVDFYNKSEKEEQEINEILDYNSETEIANVQWIYSNEKNKNLYTFKFMMKMYYPETMHTLFESSDLRILDYWGDYDRSKFNENSNLQIYSCGLY